MKKYSIKSIYNNEIDEAIIEGNDSIDYNDAFEDVMYNSKHIRKLLKKAELYPNEDMTTEEQERYRNIKEEFAKNVFINLTLLEENDDHLDLLAETCPADENAEIILIDD